MSSLRERRLGRMPSAQQVLSGASTAAAANAEAMAAAGAGGVSGFGASGGAGLGSGSGGLIGGLSLKSPLAQVKAMGSALVRAHLQPSSRHPPESHTDLDPDQPIPTGITSSTPQTALGTASAVPAPNFNLFRSASVYSTSSDASDLTFLSEDSDIDTTSASSTSPPLAPFSGLNLGEISGLSTPRAETPTTPRGVKPGQGYFDAWSAPPVQVQAAAPVHGAQQGHYSAFGQQAVAGPSRIPALTSLPPRVDSRRTAEREPGAGGAYEWTRDKEEEVDGQATPKKGFVVRSRPAAPIEPMAALVPSRQGSMAEYEDEPLTATAPSTGRSLAETHAQVAKLVAGVAPDAHAGTVTAHLPTRQSMSGEDWESIHGEQGSEWGDEVSDDTASVRGSVYRDLQQGEDHDVELGTHEGRQRDRSGPVELTVGIDDGQRPTAWLVSQPSAQSTATQASQASSASRKPKRNIIIPRRAAPPPPPGPGTPQNAQDAFTAPAATSTYLPASRVDKRPSADTLNSNFSVVSSSSSIGGSAHGSASSISTRQALQPRWPNETDASTSYGLAHDGVFDPARLPDAPSTKMDKGKGVAGRGNTDPQIPADRDEYHVRSGSASSGDARYYNVNGLTNGRSSAMPSPDMRYASSGTRTPSMDSLRSANGAGTAAASGDVLLNKGLAARARDDLAKAAWYYKQSADAGNSTGRMYWGLALKHGWGVARDDTKAFKELQQACDDALAEQGVGEGKDRRESIIQPGPRKAMSKELSMGIAEMANCFLNGTGVKKSPEAATSYLRFAADMGDIAAQERFLFSKGAQGIKKDMHEAARWYRMAIDQGSSNTFGLAWVWKDKYNS